MKIDRWFENIQSALLALMALAVPFVFYSGPNSFILPKSVAVELVVWFVAATMLLRTPVRQSPIKWPLLAFVLVYVFSITQADNPVICLKTTLLFVTGSLLAYAVSVAVNGGRGRAVFCAVIIIAGVALACNGVYNYFTEPRTVHNLDAYRTATLAGTPAAFAGWLAVAMCVAWGFAVGAKSRIGIVAGTLVMLPLAAGIVVSFSKSGMLAALVGGCACIAVSLAAGGLGARRVLGRSFFCLVLLAAAAAALVAYYSIFGVRNLDLSLRPDVVSWQLLGSKKASLAERGFVLRTGLLIWSRDPVLGNGPGTYGFHYPPAQAEMIKKENVDDRFGSMITGRLSPHVHNEYLELGVESGLLGLLVFLAVAVFAVRTGARGARNESDPAARALMCGIIGGFFALLAQAAFEFTLHDSLTAMLFWLLLGLIFSSAAAPGIRKPAGKLDIAARFVSILCIAALIAVIPRPLTAMRVMQHANNIAAQRDLDTSIKTFERALALDPSAPLIYMNYASALRAVGRYDDALTELTYASRLTADPAVHDAIGRTYAMAGNPAKAEEAFLYTLSVDPWSHNMLVNLAQAYRAQGRRDDAVSTLKRALQLYPDSTQAKNILDAILNE